MKKIWLIILIAAIFIAGCQPKSIQPVLKTGEFRLAVPGGNIWYKISGEGKGLPIVLLHGGPGMSSFYLKPFEELSNDRQVIRYDQLGAGKSDFVTDTVLFTIKHFVDELDSLRSYLRLEKWHVLGLSWGTILAIEYYHAFPDRVASLVFGGACFNIPAYEQHAKMLLTTLPDSLQKIIEMSEKEGKFDNPGYLAAMNQFYSQYLVRKPVQEDMDSTLNTINPNIYVYMQGPSEFTITGTLKYYNSAPLLPQITVPTLFTVGEFDEVGPEIVKGFSEKVPGSQYVVFPGAAHITQWDAHDENVRVVREFLKESD